MFPPDQNNMLTDESEQPNNVHNEPPSKKNVQDLCVQCSEETRLIIEKSQTDILWVFCEQCKEWIHGICSTLSEEELKITGKYYCTKCQTIENNSNKTTKKCKNSQKSSKESKLKNTIENDQLNNDNPDLTPTPKNTLPLSSNEKNPSISDIPPANSCHEKMSSSKDQTHPSSNEYSQNNDDDIEIIPNSQPSNTYEPQKSSKDPAYGKSTDSTTSYDIKKNIKDGEVSDKAKALESRTKAVILKEYKKLEKKVKEREQKLTEKDDVIEKLKNEITLINEQKTHMEKTISQLTEMKSSDETEQIRNLLEQLQTCEKKLSETNQKQLELKKVNNDKQTEIRKLKEQVNKIEVDLTNERNNYEKEINDKIAQSKLLKLTEQSKEAQVEKIRKMEKLIKDKDNMISDNYKVIMNRESRITDLEKELKTIGKLQYDRIDPNSTERRSCEEWYTENEENISKDDKKDQSEPSQNDTLQRLINDPINIDITSSNDHHENTLQRLVNDPFDIQNTTVENNTLQRIVDKDASNVLRDGNDDTLQRLVNDTVEFLPSEIINGTQREKTLQQSKRWDMTSILNGLSTSEIPMPSDSEYEGIVKYTDQPSTVIFSKSAVQTPCEIEKPRDHEDKSNNPHDEIQPYPLSPEITVTNHYQRSRSRTPTFEHRESRRLRGRKDEKQYQEICLNSRDQTPRYPKKFHYNERYPNKQTPHRRDSTKRETRPDPNRESYRQRRIPQRRDSPSRDRRTESNRERYRKRRTSQSRGTHSPRRERRMSYNNRYEKERPNLRYKSYQNSRSQYEKDIPRKNREHRYADYSEERKPRRHRYGERYNYRSSSYDKYHDQRSRKANEQRIDKRYERNYRKSLNKDAEYDQRYLKSNAESQNNSEYTCEQSHYWSQPRKSSNTMNEDQDDNDTTLELLRQFKELIAPIRPKNKSDEVPVCKFNLQKRCIFGSRCRNKHIREKSPHETEAVKYADKTKSLRQNRREL